MQILASCLFNLPVASTESQSKIGQIYKIIFDPKNGSILGFLVKTSFFQRPKVCSISDILSLDETAAVVENGDVLVEKEEIVRIDELLKQNIPILGQKAQTESGKNLGKVVDLLIDTATLMVTKFYLKDLWQERIIPADKICKITSKAVVFQDDALEGKEAVAMEAAS